MKVGVRHCRGEPYPGCTVDTYVVMWQISDRSRSVALRLTQNGPDRASASNTWRVLCWTPRVAPLWTSPRNACRDRWSTWIRARARWRTQVWAFLSCWVSAWAWMPAPCMGYMGRGAGLVFAHALNLGRRVRSAFSAESVSGTRSCRCHESTADPTEPHSTVLMNKRSR